MTGMSCNGLALQVEIALLVGAVARLETGSARKGIKSRGIGMSFKANHRIDIHWHVISLKIIS